MRRQSISRRLIATVILAQLLLACGLLASTIYYTRKRLISALDTSLQGRATSVAALVRYDDTDPGKVYFDSRLTPAPLDPDHPDLYAVWIDGTDTLLAHSANWPNEFDDSRNERHHWDFKFNGQRYRGLRTSNVPILDREEGPGFVVRTLTVVYAASEDRLEDQLEDTATFTGVACLLLLAITSGLSYWGIRRGLLPLEQLATEAGAVSASNWRLNAPQDARATTELVPLVDSMTAMLARLERTFTQEREFIGNAAHELKTPVSVLKSTLQSLIQVPRDSAEYREGIEQALEDMARLEQLLEKMMRLARAEQWGPEKTGAMRLLTPLGASCEDAMERMRPLATGKGVQLICERDGEMQVKGDPEDLQLVWTNVLENAIRYSKAGGVVKLTLKRNGNGRAQVMIADDGIGIAADDLPQIFERFYRGDPSRTRSTGGFGLGLSIAKAIVEAHGGKIDAQSEPDAGTRVTIELPLALG